MERSKASWVPATASSAPPRPERPAELREREDSDGTAGGRRGAMLQRVVAPGGQEQPDAVEPRRGMNDHERLEQVLDEPQPLAGRQCVVLCEPGQRLGFRDAARRI